MYKVIRILFQIELWLQQSPKLFQNLRTPGSFTHRLYVLINTEVQEQIGKMDYYPVQCDNFIEFLDKHYLALKIS